MTPINLEAKKHGLAQLQDGCWVLKLTVNGEDMQKAVDLLKAPMGQRYMVVMVALTEEDEEAAHRVLEKATKKRHWDELSRAEQAGILCADVGFRAWLSHQDCAGVSFTDPQFDDPSDAAADVIRRHCQVLSRAQIDTDEWSARRWDQLVSQFRQETGREAEIR